MAASAAWTATIEPLDEANRALARGVTARLQGRTLAMIDKMGCYCSEIAEERIKAAATAAKAHVLDWCTWLAQETPPHETEQDTCPGTPTVADQPRH